jgi:Zn-dependent protease
MILRKLDSIMDNPWLAFVDILTMLAAIVICITIHEFSHAFLAYKFGDDTAKLEGRLTINPIKHLDPLGSIMLLFVGFGWGKPVPVTPSNVRGNRSRNLAIISLAGPASNLIAAAAFGFMLRLGLSSMGDSLSTLTVLVVLDFIYILIYINVLLAIFNLIPVAPLDGSKILSAILPEKFTPLLIQFERWGPPILFLTIIVDAFALNIGILSRIIGPIVGNVVKLFVGF